MIKSVTVKNYILIDDLTLEFDKGFNVFTGETGAGKSIIVGAIDAAFGAKITKDKIKHDCEKAYVEVVVKLNDNFDYSIFAPLQIHIENSEFIISLEISRVSYRYRINGIPVNRDFICEIREKLIDIHSQHQSYNYVQQKNHIVLLDNFADVEQKNNLNLFKEKFLRFTQLIKQFEELKNKSETALQQRDFIEFQCKEIEAANISDVNEEELLKKELDLLTNAEKLKELSYSAYWGLNGDDLSVTGMLSKIKSNISKLTAYDDSISNLEENFENACEILKETAFELRNYSESKETDNERMEFLNERLSLFDKLKRKYGGSLDEVLKTFENLSLELQNTDNSQENIMRIENEINELKTECENLSLCISEKRKELAKILSESVTREAEKLELPKVKFEIIIDNCPMNEKGIDRVEFMISTNVSEPLKPISKVASGGEISRIMLAIKTVFADADKIETVIFDETDTGMSGKASQSVADSICVLSQSHQVILITHQPVVAAKASKHFYVTKRQEDKTTVSVNELDNDSRIKAIALMASGEINDDTVSFAQNLLGQKI